MKQVFDVQFMVCAGCEKTIKTALLAVPGVNEVETFLRPDPRVEIAATERLEASALNAALQAVGKYVLTEKQADVSAHS